MSCKLGSYILPVLYLRQLRETSTDLPIRHLFFHFENLNNTKDICPHGLYMAFLHDRGTCGILIIPGHDKMINQNLF